MQYNFAPLKYSIFKWKIYIGVTVLVFLGAIVYLGVVKGYTHAGEPLTILLVFVAGWGVVNIAKIEEKAIKKFAAVNNLSEVAHPVEPPCLTAIGKAPEMWYSYTFMVDNRQCTVFECTVDVSVGNEKPIPRTYTVACLEQKETFPHLFLDGKKNQMKAYEGSQRLSLEGDFDSYFNLYVPANEQVDALALITPDIMQTLIRGGNIYDIEFSGQYAFVIGSQSHYTYKLLPQLLQFTGYLSAELDQRPQNWSSVTLDAAPDVKLTRNQHKLRRFGPVIWAIATFLVLIIVGIVSSHSHK